MGVPAISAVGLSRRPDAPRILSKDGKLLSARLVQVQAIFRHGARTPVNDDGCNVDDTRCTWEPAETDKAHERRAHLALYRPGSGDPIDPAERFAQGSSSRSLIGGGRPGGLTCVGAQQAYELGDELRARYVDADATTSAGVRRDRLLPAGWERARRLVAARSTCVERTVYTCAGVLGGLFPELCESAPAVEVALNAADGTNDAGEYMVLNDAQSPLLHLLFQQGLALSTKHLDTEQRAVIAEVEAATGWRIDRDEWKLITYRDVYACRRAAGKPVPAALAGESSLAARLDAATAVQMHHIFEGGAAFVPRETPHDGPLAAMDEASTRAAALRLTIGRLWSRILDQLSKPDGTLHLMSGHDWSVSPLLMCILRRDDPLFGHWPPFLLNLAIELWSTRPSGRTAAASSTTATATVPTRPSRTRGGTCAACTMARWCAWRARAATARRAPSPSSNGWCATLRCVTLPRRGASPARTSEGRRPKARRRPASTSSSHRHTVGK